MKTFTRIAAGVAAAGALTAFGAPLASAAPGDPGSLDGIVETGPDGALDTGSLNPDVDGDGVPDTGSLNADADGDGVPDGDPGSVEALAAAGSLAGLAGVLTGHIPLPELPPLPPLPPLPTVDLGSLEGAIPPLPPVPGVDLGSLEGEVPPPPPAPGPEADNGRG